ncbi:MAG: two-component regulator propeller domain-containing protein, partial [Bacteroidota bacterium]
YKVSDGLSQSEILCIFQDSEGYMWLGTQNGLNKFDGYTFRSFFNDPADPGTISSNWIFDICEDQNGMIWIGTKSGLNSYDKRTGLFTTVPLSDSITGSQSNFIYGLAADESYLYINHSPHLSLLDYNSGEVSTYLSNLETGGALYDKGLPIIKSGDGKIWIGSVNGLCNFNPLTEEFHHFRTGSTEKKSISHEHITSLLEDLSGNILIGTEHGLNIYLPAREEVVHIFHDPGNPGSLSHNYIQTMIMDHRGEIWIGTDGGGLNHIRDFSPSGPGDFSHFRNLADNNRYIGHDIVISVYEDQSQNLWIGTLAGVDKLDLKQRSIKTYQKTDDPDSPDLLDNVIASIYEDEKNRLWVGTWGKGLSIIDRNTNHAIHYLAELSGDRHIPENHIHVIFRDSKSRVWLGTRNGVSIFDETADRFIPVEDYFNAPDFNYFDNTRVYCIIETSDGKFWIGTGNGICILDTERKEKTILHEEDEGPLALSRNLIYSLLEDRDGHVWIATSNGLDRYDPATQSISHLASDPESGNSLIDDYTISLCEDPRGYIWIGTSGGLSMFSKTDSSFLNYTMFDGLPSNIIYDIIRDGNDNLWFTTGSGLVMKNPAIIAWEDFIVIDELAGKEFNLKAVFSSDDGELYFGAIDGLVTFHPDSLVGNEYIPPLRITSIEKENERYSQQLSVYSDQIDLSHKDYSLTIEFSALDYTNPSRNRYQYKMEGISDQWIEIGTRHFVPFTNLPPGEYTFRVIGTNSDGVWNRQGVSIPIEIHPPWWRSNFAYGGYLILVVLAIVLIIYLRERKLLREKRILEEKIGERTAEIARKNRSLEEQRDELNELNATKDRFFSILAHDLKNPFSSLYSLSELVVENYELMEEEEKLLTLRKINQSSELIYNLLENLLTWSRSQHGDIDYAPEDFNLSTLAEINLNLHRVPAEKKRISFLSEVPENIKVHADREMINTVLRNLINNAVKYSHPEGVIELRIEEKDHITELMVRDGGTGISQENLEKIFRIDTKFKTPGTEGEKGTGLGLILCREFVEKNGGQIRVESVEGSGTTFYFTVPRSPQSN